MGEDILLIFSIEIISQRAITVKLISGVAKDAGRIFDGTLFVFHVPPRVSALHS